MKKIAFAAALLIGTSTPALAAVTVDANSTGTVLGSVIAGRQYKVTASGIVDLVGDTIPGGSFNLNADGIPQPTVTDPNYQYFNPTGSPTADGQSGPAPGVNFGALIGNYGGATPYFLLGTSSTFTATQTGSLFGRINDTNFNNSGSFSVNLTAVPEPATWAMMMLGFGMVGFGIRRRAASVTTRVAFA